MRLFVIILIFTLVLPLECFGHGEETPGPHGGVIRMPGLLHTEVLKIKEDSIKVYLLDLSFRNPTTENSIVKARVDSNGRSTELSCNRVAANDYFLCKAEDAKLFDNGNLIINANREGVQGVDALYALPLAMQQ